ncbi:MAG: family 16 glycoside hydrolase, partial [Pseudolabrys sp.]
MRIALRRTIRLALALTALGFSAGSLVSKAVSQEAGWITLFDGKSLDGWDQVGESNWRVEDGAIVVDKMAGKEAGYL